MSVSARPCHSPLQNCEMTGKQYGCFPFVFEKLRYSNERSAKFESLYQEQKYLEEENGKMEALQISPKIESLYGVLQLLQGSHLNFLLKALKLHWIALFSNISVEMFRFSI